MTSVFLDTNILLDVLLKRDTFYQPAQSIWDLAAHKKIKSFISALSVSNCFYIVEKLSSQTNAYSVTETLLTLFDVVAVNEQTLADSLQLRFPDFEDGVQYQCALQVKADVLITRDPKGFKKSQMLIMDPWQFLESRV